MIALERDWPRRVTGGQARESGFQVVTIDLPVDIGPVYVHEDGPKMPPSPTSSGGGADYYLDKTPVEP